MRYARWHESQNPDRPIEQVARHGTYVCNAYPEVRHMNKAPNPPLPEDASPVPSPCTGVCRLSPVTGLCEGCLRTIEEITAWRSLDDEGRRVVWRALRERAKAGKN